MSAKVKILCNKNKIEKRVKKNFSMHKTKIEKRMNSC